VTVLTVATWNLEDVRSRRSVRTDRIHAAMAKIDPDVWVLTESHEDFRPGAGYARIAMSCENAQDRCKGGRWVVIWTRGGMGAQPLTLHGEPERSAGMQVEWAGARPLAVFGTVLPWRSDTRHGDHRGGAAFRRSIELQSTDWSRAASTGAELCIAGDLNQEYGANGPVGTRAGRAALDETLASLALTCATGEPHDPLHLRRWGRSIDHILVSQGLHAVDKAPRIWPEQYPLPKGWPDHHGVALTITEARHS
jgi:hypothetical protein